jgi:transposase
LNIIVKLNSEVYIRFLSRVLEQTTAPLFLVQDGASYHRAAAVKRFIAEQATRLTVTQLPSYSPDYNPIEYLWRATKRDASHNQYFPEFADLVVSVEQTLTELAARPAYVRSLFTFYLQQMGQPPTTDSLPLAA